MLTKHKYLILTVILSLFTCYRLLRPGYFSMQDDTQIFRLQQFDQCLKDGQIPCRFIADGGLGYGYPLYNYYPPFVYALAEIFHLIGFSLINSIKLVFILGHITAGIGMFLLASSFWGNYGGLLSAVLYLFAPYRAIDGYVRGALAEFIALSLIPFVFYFAKKKKTNLLIISLTILFLTHNLFSLVTFPLLLIYLLLKKQYKMLIPLAQSLLLSAFFLLPAIFEKKYVTLHTITQGYFDYRAHFTTLKQLFLDRSWGFGASLWGPIDDMSFQIGWPHWFLFFVSILFAAKSKKKYKKLILLSTLVAIFCLFLTHNKSTFIWTTLPFMAYFQFPWRFLGPFVFILSFISGSILIKTKTKKIIFSLLSLLIIGLNLPYFKEDIWYSKLTDKQKLDQPELIRQSGAGLKDYWPNFGSQFPHTFAPSTPQSKENITVHSFSKTSHQAQLDTTVHSPTALITLPMVYFPNWQAFDQNQNPLTVDTSSNLGLIQLNLPPGKHQIQLKLKNTPIRTLANTISLVTLIATLIYVKKHQK